MKLIIDIPEEKYKTIQDGMYCGMLDADLYRDIKNGTPLDKIRAEIIENAKGTMNDTRAEGLYMALNIVDKYRNGVSG